MLSISAIHQSERAASIVIPVYNESDSVVTTVRQIIEVMDASEITYEVIVVDDGSTDQGCEALARDKRTILIVHEHNYGYGAALKTGIAHANYPTIVITDADRTYPNERIPELIRMMKNQDMVVGARIGQRVYVPWMRRPAKWVIRILASYLSGQRIPDLNSGLRAMRKSVLELFLPILPDGFSFTSTITLSMITNNYRVRYVPIDYHQRKGRSKIRPLYETFNFVQLIIRTVAYFQPLKVFIPLSSLLILGCVIAVIYRMFIGVGMALPTEIMFVGAMELLGLGLVADMFARSFHSQMRNSRTATRLAEPADNKEVEHSIIGD